MKIALLNDTHFGCRNDSPAFINYQNRFYDELFFPYIVENKIDTLIHLGDVVDRRKFINFNTAHNFQQKFWKRLWDLKIDTSGSNAGKLFLRKNGKSTKCKQYVFDVNSAKSFLSCASKKIGKKYIKQYIVNPIDKEIPGAKKFIMAAYNMI